MRKEICRAGGRPAGTAGRAGQSVRMRRRLALLTAALLLLSAWSLGFAYADSAAAPTSAATAAAQEKPAAGGVTAGAIKQAALQKIQLLVDQYGAASVQYAVIDEGKIVVSGQAGQKSREEAAAPAADTLYGIGSVSKIFTAAAVMQLAEEGKLSLDKPVTAYIPEFKMADERYRDITVRMLLNHSSGLLGSTLGNAFLLGDTDPDAHDAFLEKLADQRLKADPGAYSVYCNDGFTLAEIVVERISGLSFTEFVHQNITRPLGLENTKTPQDAFDRARLAGAYFQGVTPSLTDTVNFIGTGGIYSTAEDMCRFAQIFMKDQGAAKGVISADAAKQTMNAEYADGIWPQGAQGSMAYGLGWDSVSSGNFGSAGMTALNKSGDTLLFHASLIVLPEENLAAAVLSSGGSSVFNQLAGEALLAASLAENDALTAGGDFPEEVLLAALDQGTAPPVVTPKAVALPSQYLEYAGLYGAMGGMMHVSLTESGILEVTVPAVEGYKETYYHRGDGLFSDNTGLVTVSFVREKNGKTYLKVEGPAIYPGLGQLTAAQYNGQKVEANPLTEDIAAAWEKRDGKRYYVIDEKYTSQYYMAGLLAYEITFSEEAPGYMGVAQIDSADSTRAVIQIPGMMGRDLQEFHFFRQDGVEYLRDGSNLAVSEDAVKDIYAGGASVCTIPENGSAVWYRTGAAAGKTITATLSGQGSFSVYNAVDVCVNASYASGVNSVTVPADGVIVFAGEPGTRFAITMQ